MTEFAGRLPAGAGAGRKRGERILIVSGGRGTGKTSLCLALAEAARGAGLAVAGLVSPAVFVRSCKVAIELHDLASGAALPLAVRARPDAPVRMRPGALAWAGASIPGAWRGETRCCARSGAATCS